MKHQTFLTDRFRKAKVASEKGLVILSGIAFSPRYIVSQSASYVGAHEKGRNLTMKS